MPYSKVEPEKLSAAVVRQIEALILQGILRPGERLPAERDLATRMGVSRPSLREALADLENRGLLATRPNAGVFVAEVLGSAFSPALIDLFRRSPEAVFDTVAFRRDIEGLAAARAAEAASDADLAVIDTIFSRMETASQLRNPTDEARLDTDFHMAIVEASHNVVMLHMMRAMYDLLREGVFYNRQTMFRQRTSRAALLAQHRAINNALQARDASAARAAIEAHMGYVEAALRAERAAEARAAIARLRLDQETARSGPNAAGLHAAGPHVRGTAHSGPIDPKTPAPKRDDTKGSR